MDRYLVISHHTLEDCKMAVKHFLKFHANYMTHFDWGCKDGDHNAYAIIEADSHENAKMSVPPLLRDKTTVIKLVQFTPEMFPELMNDPLH
jgi:hypothetical protein